MATKASKTKTASKAKAAAKDETFSDRLTEGAREAVKRSTASAKERTDSAFETSKEYTANIESVLVRAAHGYAHILGSIAEAAYVNVNRGIQAAEKMAEVKSLSEAMDVQTTYVREQAQCSMNNARSAFDYVRDVVTENGEVMRESATKMWKREDKAA